MENIEEKPLIKVIMGLGNPGSRFDYTRHNIGFRVVDALADKYLGTWREKGKMMQADVLIGGNNILLVKPLTFMNLSGDILPSLHKKGITIDQILVLHDELEKPFGFVGLKEGGGHRGHNGLRSIIEESGPNFSRISCGIGRPEQREQVADYVLLRFAEDPAQVDAIVKRAIELIEEKVTHKKER